MTSTHKGWHLTDTVLTIDNDKEIIIITTKDISQNSELAILKKSGNFTFLDRNGTDLIITNIQDASISADEFYTIIYSQFYQFTKMREKVLSSTLLFLDQEVALKNHEAQINTARSFSSILNASFLTHPLTPPLAVDIINSTATMRRKRKVDFEFKKSVVSRATKFFPPFYEFFSWIHQKKSLFASYVSDYIVGLNKKLLQRFFTQGKKEIAWFKSESPYEKTSEMGVQVKLSIKTHHQSEIILFTEVNYRKKMSKKMRSKWNEFYKGNHCFTEMPEGKETKNTSTHAKHYVNYKHMLFPAIDLPYQDTIFQPENALSQIKANVDVNATLVLADYALRIMEKNRVY